jgi:Ricin-type beta-trefoil lectin domain
MKIRRAIAGVLAFVATSAMILVATPLPASADDCLSPSGTGANCPLVGSFIQLVNVGSDKCFLTTPQDGHDDWAGLPIQQQGCGTFLGPYAFVPLGAVLYNQGPPWWCIGCIHLGAEGFFIKNTILNTDPQGPTGLCMDVRDGATSDEAVVQQWTCRNSSARSMVWYTSQGDFPGALKVRNFNSDLCLDVRGGSSVDGAQLQQYHCTSNNPAQNFWQIVTRGTQMDLNGNWTAGGTQSAHIYEGPECTPVGQCVSILIDMSAYGRPNATGSVFDPSTITVKFPDDKTYTGQLQPPNTIKWSNGTTWTMN